MADEMTIKDITNTYGISRRAIQGYESHYLITPCKKSPRGHLIYDEKTVRKIVFIRFCQDLGFSLNEIKELINMDSCNLANKLQDKTRTIEETIEKVNLLKSKTEQIISALNNSNSDVHIHQIITGGK